MRVNVYSLLVVTIEEFFRYRESLVQRHQLPHSCVLGTLSAFFQRSFSSQLSKSDHHTERECGKVRPPPVLSPIFIVNLQSGRRKSPNHRCALPNGLQPIEVHSQNQ